MGTINMSDYKEKEDPNDWYAYVRVEKSGKLDANVKKAFEEFSQFSVATMKFKDINNNIIEIGIDAKDANGFDKMLEVMKEHKMYSHFEDALHSGE